LRKIEPEIGIPRILKGCNNKEKYISWEYAEKRDRDIVKTTVSLFLLTFFISGKNGII
jgi:hypothetical protein